MSRLSLAWIGFAGAALAVAGASILGKESYRVRLAVAPGAVERLAPAPPPARLSRPALSDAENTTPLASAAIAPTLKSSSDKIRVYAISEEAFENRRAETTGDFLESSEESAYWPDADDIVITIDGAPARSPEAILAEKTENSGRRRALGATPVAATDPELLRKTAFGLAPAIGPSGARAATVYARPFRPTDYPHVALIVGGLGLNRAMTQKAIDDLPPEVTLAFAPYAKDLEYWSERAREAGHEIMLELPMEQGPKSAAALGPAGLLTTHPRQANAERLDWLLSRLEGYFGVTNYLGAKFSAERSAIGPVLSRVRAAGLAYVDDTGAVLKFGDPAARDVAVVDGVIGGGETDNTAADLAALERTAKRKRFALAKTYLSETSFEELAAWAWRLEEADLRLAPASAVFKLRPREL